MEHGSFTPVVLTAFGGMGYETGRFAGKLIEKLSEKRQTEKSVVASYIRRKISFELVKSQVACVRGSRNLWKKLVIDTGEIEVVDQQANIVGS